MKTKKGFTLIELLIVIAIVAVLSVVVILTLNPAELLKQARDSNRISDASTMKSAISLYLADVSSPYLGTSTFCYVSTSSFAGTNCGVFATSTTQATSSSANAPKVDGTGWIPVNFSAISSGSPLGSLPIDPVNSGAVGGYYYAYKSATTTWEFNVAAFESTKYSTTGANDGGSSSTPYEVGTALNL